MQLNKLSKSLETKEIMQNNRSEGRHYKEYFRKIAAKNKTSKIDEKGIFCYFFYLCCLERRGPVKRYAVWIGSNIKVTIPCT